MKRVEADTLEEAYSKAAKELGCSVTEINCEIVQYPTSGLIGLFKKTAIIVAAKKIQIENEVQEEITPSKQNSVKPLKAKEEIKEPKEKVVKEETITTSTEKIDTVQTNSDEIVDGFFAKEESVNETESKSVVYDDDRDTPENKKFSIEIERKIQHLMKVGCVEIDTVEVDVFDGIAHIFIDGDDAALLIGKEGYRYNALSYMLFNWINAEYNLYIKLEIAEFVQAQEEMIDNYLKPIAEHIREHGRGKTKPLDGILVQIALEKLRAMFPNKYIAIKTGKDGKKFIIINDFNTKKS
ncbi:MAG TPA: protein jag [Campylobacterales bacterium]|nr:protein jag [Campylobacterales bacterium]HHS93639.1 protein jag [Campylobacterales bacterium]